MNWRHNQLVANSASGGTVVMRADPARYYSAAFCGAARRVGPPGRRPVPVTVRIDPKIAAAIAAIG